MKPPISIKNKALDFLSRREYGYYELYVKLQKYTENLDEIKTVLDNLKAKGFLSDERYINSYVNSKHKKYGVKKIRYNLLQKHVDTDLIDQVLKDSEIDEYEIAHTIWQRKFGVKPKDNNEKAKQVRFLQSRGFSYEIIAKILTIK